MDQLTAMNLFICLFKCYMAQVTRHELYLLEKKSVKKLWRTFGKYKKKQPNKQRLINKNKKKNYKKGKL